MTLPEEEEKGLIAWFAHNHVAANLMMIIIILAGLFSVYTIPKKSMPDFDLTSIQITTAYPGATPTDVEKGIIILIEEAVEDVDGINDVRSVAREGSGTVTLEIDESYDINEVLNDVKTRVDGIINFPVEAEPPAVSRTLLRNDALRIELYGDIDPVSQKELAQQLREELLALPDVSAVRMAGDRPYEISIEVSENTLLKYGLTLDQIAQRIRASSLDLPAGSIDTEGGEIVVRTQALAYDYQDFDRIVLMTTRDGTILTVGDIATVIDGFEDTETYARFDGKPSISLTVLTTDNQNMLKVTEAARNFVAERQQTLPDGISRCLGRLLVLPAGPPRPDDRKPAHGRPAGAGYPEPVPGTETGLLGHCRHSHLLPRRLCHAAGGGSGPEHAQPVRFHHGARDRGGRCHHHR
jgi:multidrug efflux pump subunit AcrB